MKTTIPASFTCSTSEAAKALGVSVRTAQLWVESGRLQAWKTPGGHRRILRAAVDRLVDQQRMAPDYTPTQLSILILEDGTEHGDLLKSVLQGNFPDCLVIVAGNAFECLLRIGEQAPDVLITDLCIADQNNFRMLEAVNRDDQLLGMLIIVTANDPETLRAAQERLHPGIALINRSTDLDELLRLIRAYLQGRQPSRRTI